MRNLRRTRCLLLLVCLLTGASGCQVLYRYRPIAVLVRNAETKQPIADAEVHLSYPLSRDSLAPFDSLQRTGSDGIAHLRAAPYGEYGARVEASAAGYLPEQQSMSKEMIQRIAPAHPFESVEQRVPEFVVEMYAEPRFTVELIVPTGYRGLIKAEVQVQDNVAPPSGQRCFRYEVVNGSVQVKGPSVLRRISPPEFRARYADGTPLTDETTVFKVGFRWLRGQGQQHYYVVGTKSEYDMQRRFAPDEDPAAARHSAARGGHVHRHLYRDE